MIEQSLVDKPGSLISIGIDHRHLREIDCSLAIVGGLAASAECGGKSIHLPRMWHQKVLHSVCFSWQQNYYCQQRQAGWANEQSTSLRCLWHQYMSNPTSILKTRIIQSNNHLAVVRHQLDIVKTVEKQLLKLTTNSFTHG